MTDQYYLIAIALIEQDQKRALPLGGKSINQANTSDDQYLEKGKGLITELLVRVLQRSDQGAIKRAASNQSLLLVCISMDNMQKQLTTIKEEWIESGDLRKFMYKLEEICERVWAVDFTKHEGIQFTSKS